MKKKQLVLQMILLMILGIQVAGCRSNGTSQKQNEPTSLINPAKEKAQAKKRRNACKPLPKAGQACRKTDTYCVISWGKPGGWSQALWCTNGKWVLQKERNLRR